MLDAIYDDTYLNGTMWLVNPALVFPHWNQAEVAFRFRLDGKLLTNGTDYRYGLESTTDGNEKNLVIWLEKIVDLNFLEDHNAELLIEPVGAP